MRPFPKGGGVTKVSVSGGNQPRWGKNGKELFYVEGGTLVAYITRTSTDAVTGFGGGTKRAIGTKLLASQLEDLFEKLRKAAVN